MTLSATSTDNTNMPMPRITKEVLKERLDAVGATAPLIIDARLKYPYEHSTVKLPGAMRIAPPHFDISDLPRDREIVAYDSDLDEIVSTRLVAKLIREGYKASVLKGGIVEWLAVKFPTEQKEAPKQKPPKAGSLKG